jgi:hypothetical protein
LESIQDRLLSTLRFPEIGDRQESIPDALKNTFEWIYHDPAPDAKPWANFTKWLELGDGIYWITGKPGSGKSTLMKFLHIDRRTTEFLQTWSKDSQLTTAGFFFWNSGSEMQMSQGGLLRSLLYDIAKGSPDLIPKLFPESWEIFGSEGKDSRPPTLEGCKRSLRRLTDPAFAGRMFFFFIDGLDEFAGDLGSLISLLKDITRSPNVKICVASRPWVVFQSAFNRNPSLMLQDLTRPDIELYVKTKFDHHMDFRELKEYNPQLAGKLYTEIALRSSGVFLWVRLVVQSLLSGISNGDRVSDLYRRLDELPEDLESLFRKMLHSMEPLYRAHASQLFQIHRAAASITILRLSFADEEDDRFWQDDEAKPLSDNDINIKVKSMKRRLDSITKGLLEVARYSCAPENSA